MYFRPVKILKTRPDAFLPQYMTPGAAGMDVRLPQDDCVTVQPGHRLLIKLGFKMELPPGFEAQLRPRSGLALKHGITVLNSPGTIDEDYRGEMSALLINHGEMPVKFAGGDRLAQLVITPVDQFPIEQVDELSETQRGEGGYGSTGLL